MSNFTDKQKATAAATIAGLWTLYVVSGLAVLWGHAIGAPYEDDVADAWVSTYLFLFLLLCIISMVTALVMEDPPNHKYGGW